MDRFIKRNWNTGLTWLLALAVFAADFLFSLEFDLTYFYPVILLTGVFLREKNDIILLAVGMTVMIVISATLKSASELSAEEMLLRRLPVLASLALAAYLLIRYIDLRQLEAKKELRFSALFEHASSGILLADRQGSIVMVNPAAEQLFGYEPNELIGQKIEALIPNRFAKKHVEYRESFHEAPKARAMGTGLDLYAKRKNGEEFPIEVSLSPFRDDNKDFIIAFVIDNSVRKAHEQSILNQKYELAQLSEALKELNENLEDKVTVRTLELEEARNSLSVALEKERELGDLKSRFVSMASHEFRTPLSAVLSSASLILSYAERLDIESIKKHAGRIKNAVNGLNTILTEFLSLGKLEDGKIKPALSPVNIPEAIQDVCAEMSMLFKAGQEYKHYHVGAETAMLDGGLIRNILVNLISNAIKYSPEDTLITIESEVTPTQAIIKVIDQGVGIPEEDQKHLFGRFFRAQNVSNIHGTGLGLYIVKRYVEMLNGSIGFESAPGKGSTFTITFELGKS